MSRRIPLADFITLGEHLWFLQNPQQTTVQTYFDQIAAFAQALTDCDFPTTRAAAEKLSSTIQIFTFHRTHIITNFEAEKLRAMVETIKGVLYREAGEIEISAIRKGAVSQNLRNLDSRAAFNDVQKHLLAETILCIEAGANRAAVVMGWNLAYDHIRQWVFDNRITDFNLALAKRLSTRNQQPLYQPIKHYSDFFQASPSERTVIEICFDAGIIGGSVRDNLLQHLRRRNNYAHRSWTTPSSEQSNAYIHDLIDIITSPPF